MIMKNHRIPIFNSFLIPKRLSSFEAVQFYATQIYIQLTENSKNNFKFGMPGNSQK